MTGILRCCGDDICWLQVKAVDRPWPACFVDGVGTIDVKYPPDVRYKNSGRWFDGGALKRADALTLRVGKTKLMLPDVGSMSK